MEGSINGRYHQEDEDESSSQYTAVTSSPDIPMPGKSELGNSTHHEMLHASDLSDNSVSSVLRVDVRRINYHNVYKYLKISKIKK